MDLPGETRVVDDVPRAFAQIVAEAAPRSLALSGGTLAPRCYAALRDVALAWHLIDVFFSDERIVPLDQPDSNEGAARRVLLDAVAPKALHSMLTAGAEGYEAVVRSSPPIDVVHLGLGPDGHVASLFPGSPALEERRRFVVETADHAHPHRRITFTFPAIARAHLVLVTVAGEAKRDAVERIRAGEDLPGTRIRAAQVVWLGDRAAFGG
jgi:6-phosphogluconolactonase